MDGAAPDPGRGYLVGPAEDACAGLRLRHFPDPRRQPSATIAAVAPAPDLPTTATTESTARSLLSSCSGRILHMLLVLTGGLLVGTPCPAETMLRAASRIPRISIVAHRACIGRIEALLHATGCKAELIAAPDDAALWGWAQDRIVVCRDGATGAPVILHGASREARDTAHYAALARPDARCVALASCPEGGNILADEGICFVGMDDASRFGAAFEGRRAIVPIGGSIALPRRGPSRFAVRPGDLRWREAVDRSLSRPGTRQPVFHLDMFMTLAGNNRVLVGDPLAASRMIGLPLPEGFPWRAFDEIAADLERRGVEVIRNPLPFVYFDDPEARMREWFYASANNGWVEHVAQGQSRVWLPQYGFGAWPELAVTDAANAALWRALGFEVVPAGDFLPLADQLGALNCVSKVLEREA